MRKQMKFEAVLEEGKQWCVKTQPRKNGSWLTVCDTWATPPLGNAQEIAEMIAAELNHREMLRVKRTKKEHLFNQNDVCVYCGVTAEDETIAPVKCR